ncbi:hypothetical protein [Ekhidna sp.]|uniref:hypothetical protein n=1 Tax=Ekhidna sp. TaxID=2608089 RepID=UPI003BAD51A7
MNDELGKQIADYFKKRIQKTKGILIATVLIITFIIILLEFISPDFINVYNKCDEAQEINEMTFKGVISKKRNPNSQHGLHFLVITSQNEKEIVLVLDGDSIKSSSSGRSYLWEFLNVGDSVLKRSGTFEISYKKPKGVWEIQAMGFNLCE